MDTFYFEQQNILKCLNCGFEKISYNISNIIIFPLEKVREYMISKSEGGFLSVTLDNCFENYQVSEVLDGQNQIYCNNCNIMSDASTQNKIFTCPEVMTIILNRGKGLEFDVIFEYPLLIDISKYVVTNSNEKCIYELIGVLSHFGPSGMAGHFIAFCKSPVDNKWYCYNDAIVSQCIDPTYQKNGEIEGIPYVLFYQKKKENKENIIILYININKKQFYLDVDINTKINDFNNMLIKKYNLPNKINLFLYKNNNQEVNARMPIDNKKTLKDYNLKNEAIITVVDK